MMIICIKKNDFFGELLHEILILDDDFLVLTIFQVSVNQSVLKVPSTHLFFFVAIDMYIIEL